MRLPKLPGFKSVHRKAVVVTLDLLSKNYKNGETVSKATLFDKGLIKISDKVKILNTGSLTVKLSLSSDVSVSKSAVALFTSKSAETEIKSEAKSDSKKPVAKTKVAK